MFLGYKTIMDRSGMGYQVKWQHRPLMPATALCRGVSLLKENDKDFLITRLIQHIEDLHIYKGVNTSKTALSARSLGVHLPYELPICYSSLESVLKHHCNNQLRMLTHRWKRLGLPHTAAKTRDAQPPGHTWTHLDAFKAESPLRITPIQASPTVALRDMKQGNEETVKASLISDTRIPEVRVNDLRSHNTSVLVQLHSDNSDLSDQEKESVQTSRWAAPMDLDLRPEPFQNDLGSSMENAQIYPEVLPVPLKCLSSPANPEAQQRQPESDPYLAPVVARLMELERLQAATVQKERAKPVRSRPATANTSTRSAGRLRKGNLPGSRLRTSGDVECNSVACSFTKLSLCPNSCRCRHLTCPLTKPGQGYSVGGRDSWLNLALPKQSHVTSNTFNRPEALVPAFSVGVNVLPKPTPNRTRRLRAAKKTPSKPQKEDSTYSRKILATLSRKT